MFDRVADLLRGSSGGGGGDAPSVPPDGPHVIRRSLVDEDDESAPASAPTVPASSSAPAAPRSPVAPRAAAPDLEALVERAVERLERRIVEELRRRGRWTRPGVW
jgi:hypothetical protein